MVAIAFEDVFDRAMTFPDVDARDRYGALVARDQQKERMLKALSVLVSPRSLVDWADQFHPDAKPLLVAMQRRPPLVVLAGDVGSGKTELATTIGDELARQEKIEVTLLPLSLSARGSGRVGEITQLIGSAFSHAAEYAGRYKGKDGRSKGAVLLLVDEADAIAQSREAAQMHHEDRAGVNAFIRGIDGLAAVRHPAAVIMCTNRPASLDPAIRRRAAEILLFGRPDEEERRTVLEPALRSLGLDRATSEELVRLTGEVDERPFGFTFSDLTQRLLPAIVLRAFPHSAVTAQLALEIVRSIAPTTPFEE